MAPSLSELPPEVILHIYSFLDLPDLESVGRLSSFFATLASDPVLHRNRIRIVAPSRLRHSLFGHSPQGIALRPTFCELIHRNVLRGLKIESRWRRGEYLYTQGSIHQYELRSRLDRFRVSRTLAGLLKSRQSPSVVHPLFRSGVLQDEESSSLTISTRLLPIVRKLKWSLKRDKLSQKLRNGECDGLIAWATWLEKSHSIVKDHERVRLALCPDMRSKVRFYDSLVAHQGH